jgi:large subunit ribosomal protein L10
VYNIKVRRQQVPVKALSFPAEVRITLIFIIMLSFSRGWFVPIGKRIFLLNFYGGGKMPSNKILEEKKQVVETLASKLQSAAAGVLVKYEGIKVSEDTELRAALRKAGVEYTVMKNTLTGRACDIAGYGDMKQYLSGMTAIAFSQDDALAPAKIMKQFADKIECFEIKAGFVDGGVLDQAGVEALAATPSKEVLIAKMMGSLMSSLYGFAYVLQGKIDKENEGGETAEAPAEA